MKYEDISNPFELYRFMKHNIKYGFVSNINNEVYTRDKLQNDELYEKLLLETYYLQNEEELLKSGYGLCYDQTLFANSWLKSHNYETFLFFEHLHNHLFIVYKENYKYYVFERTFKTHNGITEFDSLNDAVTYFKCIDALENNTFPSNIKVSKARDIEYHMGFNEILNANKKKEKVLKLANN